MTQTQLDRAVARATGENVETIQRLGFSPVRPPQRFNPRLYPRPGVRNTPVASPRNHPKERV
jgi:hypothetical protein